MKIRILLTVFALLFVGATQSQAQVSANEVASSGNVTYFKYLIPHDIAGATQTVPVDVSRASSVSILLASGSTASGAAVGGATVALQGKSGTLSTATATFAPAPVSIGGATETIAHYGLRHYPTAGLSFMRISAESSASAGLIIILGIKED